MDMAIDLTDAEVTYPEPRKPDNTSPLSIDQEINPIVSYAESLIIQDQEGNKTASENLKLIKQLKKKIGDQLDPGIKKAHELHKELNASKKKFTEPLDKAEKLIKEQIAVFLTAEEERQKKELEEIPDDEVVIPAPQAEKVKGISSTVIYDFVVVDKSKIPLEYMIPNETMIRQVVKASKGAVQIPGIKITEKKSISARGDSW